MDSGPSSLLDGACTDHEFATTVSLTNGILILKLSSILTHGSSGASFEKKCSFLWTLMIFKFNLSL